MKIMLLFSFVALACALVLTGCTKKAAPTSTEMTPEQLISRGKAIYVSNCMACHNVDPSKDGAVGPSVAGSSKELLEERILRAAYPAGYKPKRETRAMVALPHLQNEIPALTAYLANLGGNP
jgi:mono/diheme cytochrome c family protein